MDVPLILIADDPPPRMIEALTRRPLGRFSKFRSPAIVDNPRPLAFAHDSGCKNGIGHEGEQIGSLIEEIIRARDFDDDAAGARGSIGGERRARGS